VALLGKPLLVLLSILTVGLPIATYLLWSRLPGRQVMRFGARVVLLVSCQLAAVLLVAAAMNDYGYFYTSWSDLVVSTVGTPAAPVPQALGAGPGVAQTGTNVRSDQTAVLFRRDPLWSTPSQWTTRGRVVQVHIHGARSALSATASVWLPPQYFQPAYAHSRFPAVEVLTGYPGSETGLISGMKYPQYLLDEITAHRAAPMVLVMMRSAVAFPRDTECTDVPAGPQALTYFSQDVPAAISNAFRVRATGWGAMGDSTGGYCAVKIAMMHSDVIPAAAALSGYFHTLRDNTTGDLWGGSAEIRKLNDLEWRLAHLPAPPASLFLAISRTEAGPNGYRDTQKFLSRVRSPLQVQTMILPSGGHNFSSWSVEMGPSLDWLSARLRAAAVPGVPLHLSH
jgi:S-formylglutathione hydrolase FrmB